MKLQIKRQSAFVGCAMKYRIIIDGIEYGRVGNGDEVIVDVPDRDFTLQISMVGNSMNVNKVEATAFVQPQLAKNGIIRCSIESEFKWKGFWSLGFAETLSKLHLDIIY